MSESKRWLIGHRRGPRIDPGSRRAIDLFLEAHPRAKGSRSTHVGRQVIEMPEAERRELALTNPDLVIEADEPLQEPGLPGLPPLAPAGGSVVFPVSVTDLVTAEGVVGVTVYGIGRSGVAYRTVTDDAGLAVLNAYEPALVRLIASPRDTFWSQAVPGAAARASEPLAIRLKPLLSMGAYDWGRRLSGFREAAPFWKGSGVRIGIIGAGVDDRHPALKPAGGHNALSEGGPEAWKTDETGRGTHAAGIIAGLKEDIGVYGGAPAAQVYAVKATPGGRLADLVDAVEWCILNRMDVIHIGVMASKPSRILAGVLQDAVTRGIVCVAPAGDGATHVAYPAALPSVIGVGAIGRFHTFPEESAHALYVSQFLDWRGELFAARFSNFGPEIELCASGVAVLSTVPGGYAAWDGTSAASALVTSLCALIIEACPSCRTGDARGPEYVRSIIRDNAADLGMPLQIQGRGLACAVRALALSGSCAR